MADQNTPDASTKPILPELTPDLIARICHHMTVDWVSLPSAAALCGVSGVQAESWINQGQEELIQGKETLCSFMVRQVQSSVADVERQALALLRDLKTHPKAWTRWAWFLERRYPSLYSLIQHMRVSATVEVTQMPLAQSDAPVWLQGAATHAAALILGSKDHKSLAGVRAMSQAQAVHERTVVRHARHRGRPAKRRKLQAKAADCVPKLPDIQDVVE